MEEALKPEVIAKFEKISKVYKRFKKVQVMRVEAALKQQELTPAQEKRYLKLHEELIELVTGVHLNNNRIEALVDQLYGINRRLIGLEGRLLRLAESPRCRVWISSNIITVMKRTRAGSPVFAV